MLRLDFGNGEDRTDAMIPRMHKSSTIRQASATMASSNANQRTCHKCFNVLETRPKVFECNYHGCRGRIPIELVTHCPKGEF